MAVIFAFENNLNQLVPFISNAFVNSLHFDVAIGDFWVFYFHHS